MARMTQRRLGEMLMDARVIDEDQLTVALGKQRDMGGTLGRHLVELGFIAEAVLVETLSLQLNLPIADLKKHSLAPELKTMLPVELMQQKLAVPFALLLDGKREVLKVAMAYPLNLATIDEVQFRSGRRVVAHIAGERAIQAQIKAWYPEQADLLPHAIEIIDWAEDPTGEQQLEELLPVEDVPAIEPRNSLGIPRKS